LGLSAFGVLLYLAGTDDSLRKWLSGKRVAALGVMSYSLYLIHAPVLQLIWVYIVRRLPISDDARFVTLVLFGVPMIVAAAAGFYWCCERPFARKRGASYQRAIVPAAAGPTLSPV
jgi:peptidoglycan/LPS O-acetylase OafA/YrhL